MIKKSISLLSVIALLFTVVLSAGPSSKAAAKELGFEPFQASIEEISAALEANKITSEQLVEYYLERIAAYDKQGPAINAIITINQHAIQIAKQLDDERKTKGSRSILHGIPIIVKDNYNTLDMPTSGGSAVLKESMTTDDAFVVQKLRDAGAIILAKSNMSELATSNGRLGYSSAGGLTLNPYNLNRDASGSSSGTAAAVAADFGVFGLGSDTGGSIRGPANVTGLVGVKPTLGLTSRSGVIPLSLSFDVTGPMARSVTDAAIALSFMTGVDENDYATLASGPHIVKDYSAALDASSLKGARIGLATEFFGENGEVDAITEQAIGKMTRLGATFVPVTFSEDINYLWDPIMGKVGEAEFKPQFERYLATLSNDQPKTLQEFIQISESPAISDSTTPVNPKRINSLKAALNSQSIGSPEYIELLTKSIPAVRAEVQNVMKRNNLDAIVYPTMSCPATPRFDKEDPTYSCTAYDEYAGGYIASTTGFPDITLPAGSTKDGLPVGISFIGLPYSEQKLLNLAYSFEQATLVRTAPTSTPKLK
jgi:amidase